MSKLEDIKEFYNLLNTLHEGLGGYRYLKECNGRSGWPDKGVYFFFEKEEERRQSGAGLRVVRVGTHAVSRGSSTTLWSRLYAHRGSQKSGGGNHRGSVFRELVGYSLSVKNSNLLCDSWGENSSAPRKIREIEHNLECSVSNYIGAMPFLWLEVEGESSSDNKRSLIERNSIALLSNWNKVDSEVIDHASDNWLGSFCPKENIPRTGLWNSEHVDDAYNPDFLNDLRQHVNRMLRKGTGLL